MIGDVIRTFPAMQPNIERGLESVVARREDADEGFVKMTDFGASAGSLEVRDSVEPLVDSRLCKRRLHFGENSRHVFQVLWHKRCDVSIKSRLGSRQNI